MVVVIIIIRKTKKIIIGKNIRITRIIKRNTFKLLIIKTLF